MAATNKTPQIIVNDGLVINRDEDAQHICQVQGQYPPTFNGHDGAEISMKYRVVAFPPPVFKVLVHFTLKHC